MNGENRLYMFLYWLRKYHSYSDLADKFGISAPTVSREIHFLAPRVYPLIQCIEFPVEGMSYNHQFSGATLAIDCTPHPRVRPHPGQSQFYNGSRGYHCLYVQCISDLAGRIVHVFIGQGRNNDTGMYTLSGARILLREANLIAIGDRGYDTNETILAPMENYDEDSDVDYWNSQHYHFRAVIENVFAIVKQWMSAKNQFKQFVILQKYVLGIIYNLAADNINQKPLRKDNFF